ncbi:MAG: hypothetical protein DRH24_06485 [Deltaproteobacteria bacterium]|nr:MAG: hypothetical protein DRH24_06485 [Deltaproteobacteria bacterium]
MIPKQIKNRIDLIHIEKEVNRLLMLKRLPFKGKDKIQKRHLLKAKELLEKYKRLIYGRTG